MSGEEYGYTFRLSCFSLQHIKHLQVLTQSFATNTFHFSVDLQQIETNSPAPLCLALSIFRILERIPDRTGTMESSSKYPILSSWSSYLTISSYHAGTISEVPPNRSPEPDHPRTPSRSEAKSTQATAKSTKPKSPGKQFEDYWKRFHKDQPAPKPFPKYDYTNERRVFMLFLVNKTWCQIAMEEVLEKHDKGWFGNDCWYLLRDRRNEMKEVIRKWRSGNETLA